MTFSPPTDLAAQYAALTTAVGLADWGDRNQLELTGADRAIFLHNLSTNDFKSLAAGQGREAFVTNPQGKILGHVLAFIGDESLVLEMPTGQSEPLAAHFDRYIIREDVVVHDRSQEWTEWLLSGPQSPELLRKLTGEEPPTKPLAHAKAAIAGRDVWLRRAELLGAAGYLVACRRAEGEEVSAAIVAGGAVPCGAEVVDACRIEAGFPLYGRDITNDNLPQEVDRNPLAISFQKGCYIGQETIARIDALGHVNKLLTGVKFAGETVPPVGEELLADGKTVGHVTSACLSPALGAPLALAYVRRAQHAPGSQLESASGPAEVVSLPVR